MTVNAYTTVDLLEVETEGYRFTEEAYAVINVTSRKRDPDHVSLQFEPIASNCKS